MAFVAPLKGVRFNTEKAGRLDDIVTPPYDVIREGAVANFSAKNPYSMIRLDIVKDTGGNAVDPGRYSEAAGLFRDWLRDGVLIRDEEEAIYLYETRYVLHNGRIKIRKGLLCLVGLAELHEGVVKPHEKTFDSVVSDRLNLLRHCRAQFSQIFSLYSDPDNTVIDLLEKAPSVPAGEIVDADGCIHAIHKVTDKETIRQVQRFFIDRSLYIADGHHRYTTALAYRKQVREERGGLRGTDPVNHVMMYLCPMEDPGLSVLPTHRLLYWPGKLDADQLSARLAPMFDLTEIRTGSRETLIEEALARMDEIEQQSPDRASNSFGVYHAGDDRCFVISLKESAKGYLEDHAPSLSELDVVVLSELIVKRIFTLSFERCEKENLIHFFSDPDEALDTAVKDSAVLEGKTPLLFLMNPTRVDQVRKVADDNLIMPHKSTYFYPKIMTGLLFYQLIDDEVIQRLD
jgi:uncharacterized protein (DUF1015 family)